ncbi:MAG: nucleotidyltransferase domain-containing protein [Archaeoglobales archaeon]|nr:nucleotidyltransferase domain-containing protein [Archaeoglobales archaeon]
MRPIRLRDFVRIGDCYFSVLGYRNTERVKCFLRYSPNEKGNRVKEKRRFKKLSHEEALAHPLAKKYFEQGIFRVPLNDVEEVFKPEERLKDVMDLNVKKIVEFFSSIPLGEMGVTGSRLIGLESDESDVDFIVYGNWWFLAREKLKKGIENGALLDLDDSAWEFIYRKRRVPIPYELFVAHEKRKFHRAYLGETYFDLLYVRGYEEIDHGVPEEMGVKLGKRTIEAKIKDDRYVFDYPAYYPVEHKEIEAILCFTHTFAGQAFKGEKIIAKGDLEDLNGKKFLIVGTKREVEDEFIISKDLIEKEGFRLSDYRELLEK